MCGFVGFLGCKNFSDKKNIFSLLKIMNNTLIHRGPNSEGYWSHEESQIFFGHRRLSIIDLSPSGNQPMESQSSEFTIIFNGEIYNHLELRDELAEFKPGILWRGNSDTETILASIDFFGIEKTLKKLVGMFSFALWSKKTKTLTLARDRLGEKPLYYGWQGSGLAETFLFGSELKALRLHPSFQNEIDKDSINLFMKYNNIPAPYSIYKNINKLKPGCFLQVSLLDKKLKIYEYWSYSKIINEGLENSTNDDESFIINEIEKILKKTIKQQMVADVPLGAFLSGGIDSSTIVSLMQSQSMKKINTFSIGFHEAKYDEANFAKNIARHLGTEHNELYVSSEEATSIITDLPEYYDEPFSDSSQIPTFLVSKLAKKKVTVSLSGDGGDEVFGGYNRYLFADQYLNFSNKLPKIIKSSLKKILLSRSINDWNYFFSFFSKNNNFGEKFYKIAKILDHKDILNYYDLLISNWKNPNNLVIGSKTKVLEQANILNKFKIPSNAASLLMFFDMTNYLPNDILTKVDRASMSVSLETRLPFLDHNLIEYMSKVPQKLKIRNGKTKWVLRQILHKYVPKEKLDRRKFGFAVPIDSWLRGPLKDWAAEMLDEKKIINKGFLNHREINKKWEEHKSGKKNWHHQLWSVLMFQAWSNKYL